MQLNIYEIKNPKGRKAPVTVKVSKRKYLQQIVAVLQKKVKTKLVVTKIGVETA
jgi:hypothetical protein